MKPTLLPLLLLLVLASCTITKRKYMPGYAVNWGHKTTATMVVSKPDIGNNPTNLSYVKPIATNNQILLPPQPSRTRHVVSLPLMPLTKVGTSYMMSTPLQAQWKGLKRDFGGIAPVDSVKNEKVVCKQANRSLTLGILSLIIPIAILFIAYIIAVSEASGGNSFAFFIFFPAAILGTIIYLILGIIGIVSGAIALDRIKENPKKYSGKWKAIIGILLVLLPFIIYFSLIPFLK